MDSFDHKAAAAPEGFPSIVFTIRARPGREDAVAPWAQRIVRAARQVEGSLAATVVGPDSTGKYRFQHFFKDEPSLARWLSSATREQLLLEAEPMLEGPPHVQRTGLEMWFRLPRSHAPLAPPPRWKMWLVSLVATYPMVLAFLTWITPRLMGLPMPVRAAVLSVGVLTLMTYVVMPALTCLLRSLLFREPAGAPQVP
jgi:antibiotic biosynthesis monooxygenase (ABM) superfamily enzyme